MKIIPLSKNLQTKVNDDWFNALNIYNWCAQSNNFGRYYAVRYVKINGISIKLWMHKIIGGKHINDTLDNTRENLGCNTIAGKSEYEGVSWNIYYGMWEAKIFDLLIGYYQTELEAKEAFDKKRIQTGCKMV